MFPTEVRKDGIRIRRRSVSPSSSCEVIFRSVPERCSPLGRSRGEVVDELHTTVCISYTSLDGLGKRFALENDVSCLDGEVLVGARQI